MEDNNLVDTLENSLLDLVDGFVDYAPRILVALLLVFLGMMLARFVSKWVAKGVDMLENSAAAKKATKSMGVKNMNVDGIVKVFTYWAVLLIFSSAAVDTLGLAVLTDTFNSLISFIPSILAAALIAALSFVAANAIQDVVSVSAKQTGIKVHGLLAKAAKTVVLVFGLTLAAAQLGLDLTIINNNITVVVAGIMLAFGLAFGLGGRSVAEKMLNNLYDASVKK